MFFRGSGCLPPGFWDLSKAYVLTTPSSRLILRWSTRFKFRSTTKRFQWSSVSRDMVLNWHFNVQTRPSTLRVTLVAFFWWIQHLQLSLSRNSAWQIHFRILPRYKYTIDKSSRSSGVGRFFQIWFSRRHVYGGYQPRGVWSWCTSSVWLALLWRFPYARSCTLPLHTKLLSVKQYFLPFLLTM